MRIGPRCGAVCANITSSTGSVIAWVSEIRYLGVYFSRFRRFNCSIDHAKRPFYKAANSVYGKIGRIASEEVTLQLVKSKCTTILLYGLEVCELSKSQITSLDFTINRFLWSFSALVILKWLNIARTSMALNYLALCCPNAQQNSSQCIIIHDYWLC